MRHASEGRDGNCRYELIIVSMMFLPSPFVAVKIPLYCLEKLSSACTLTWAPRNGAPAPGALTEFRPSAFRVRLSHFHASLGLSQY